MAAKRGLDGRIAWILAFLAGAFTIVGVGRSVGLAEVWASGLYFELGVPALVLVCAALGFLSPGHHWRLGLAAGAGQAGALLVHGSGVSETWPGLLVALVIAVPCGIAAALGGRWAQRRSRPGG